MEIKDIRRAKLIAWFANRSVPAKEKSYLSQLMSGTASFGERAARRLESTYGMGCGYLDTPINDSAPDLLHHEKSVSNTPARNDAIGGDLQRALIDQAKLLVLYWSADADGRSNIITAAQNEVDHASDSADDTRPASIHKQS